MPHVEEDGPADELCKSEFYLNVLLNSCRYHGKYANF